jgi:two-component system response regulator VicR
VAPGPSPPAQSFAAGEAAGYIDAVARILIIEDEPGVARGLEHGLRGEGYEVLRAATGRQGLELLERQTPHLLLLDLRLPDIDGYEVCRRVRAAGNPLPILMLTARDEEADKVLGLELGADDYVVKPFSFRELLSRIRAQLRRAYGELAGAASGGRLRFGAVTVELERLRVFRAGVEVPLTPMELRLLIYLAERPGRPLSRTVILEEVWGSSPYFGEERTVDVHMRHLRQKLEDDPAHPRYLKTVRGQGYMFEAEQINKL